MLCFFLAALEQVCPSVMHIELFDPQVPKTIVAAALPTIVRCLGGGSRYSWVGRFVFPSWRLSFTSLTCLSHIGVCCQFCFFLSISLIFVVFHPWMGSCRTLSVANLYCTPPLSYSWYVIPYIAQSWADFCCLAKLGSTLCGSAQTMVQCSLPSLS